VLKKIFGFVYEIYFREISHSSSAAGNGAYTHNHPVGSSWWLIPAPMNSGTFVSNFK
jgi:hypothetical protein